MHADFDHGQTLLPGSRDHFGVHEEVIALWQQRRKLVAMKNLQGTIDIAERAAEQYPDHTVVTPGEESSPDSLPPVDSVTADDIVLPCQRQHRPQLGQVELAIGIGETDQVEDRRLEASLTNRNTRVWESTAGDPFWDYGYPKKAASTFLEDLKNEGLIK